MTGKRNAVALVTAVGSVAVGLAVGAWTGRRAEHTLVRARRTQPDPLAEELLAPPRAERSRVVLSRDGVALHVEEVGDPAAELTVVFAHGWTLTQASWFYQRRDLVGPGVRCVFYDQRGHGQSGRPDPDSCTIENFSDDLVRVVESARPAGKVVLVGHSMGGMTVLGLVADHPEWFGPAGRVAAVALLSTSAGRLGEVTFGLPAVLSKVSRVVVPAAFRRAAANGDRWERYRVTGSDATHALTRRLSFAGEVPPAAVELMELMISQTPLTVAAACAEGLARHDKLAALPTLAETPTLILVGEEDLLTPVAHSRAMADALPSAELVVVAEAGHMVQLERPGLVTEQLRQLLRRALAPVET